MTKYYSSILIAALLLAAASCGRDRPEPAVEATEETAAIDTFNFDTLCGVYYGDFGGTELRLVLDFVSEGHAIGSSIVKGLQRNVSGTVKLTEHTVEMELAEPGDNEYDGVFSISFDRITYVPGGTWKPNDPKLKSKTFVLEKVVYDDEQELTTTDNFTNYFGIVGDSIGRIEFENNGLCTYVSEGNDADYKVQKMEFTGSWSVKDGKVRIEWQENPVFPSRKSVFKIEVDKTNYLYALRGESRVFEEIYN